MPKYRVETNAGTYEIEADREPTANDVESYLRQSQSDAPKEEVAVAEVATPTETAVVAAETPVQTSTEKIGNELKAGGWEALNRTERFNLFVRNLPGVVGRELFGLGSKAEGMAERAIPTAVGQTLGRATELPGGAQVGGFLGGVTGEVIAQTREGGKGYRPGAILGAGISGAVTGKPLAGATQSEVMREGGKYAAGNLAGKVAETEIDEGRLPTVSETGQVAAGSLIGAQVSKALSRPAFQGKRDAIFNLENKTLRDLQGEGVLVPPHKIDGGKVVPTFLAGADVMDAAVAKRNQFAWQKLAREDIGLSKEALPISVAELDARRAQLAAPYQEIKTFQEQAADSLKTRLDDIAKNNADPHDAAIALSDPATKASLDRLGILAAADIDELKIVRDSAKSARKAFDKGDPAAYETWQALKAKAEGLEDAIEKAAEEIGDKTLVDRLKFSRKQIAQTYSVEESLNQGNGFVDPLALGRKLANGDKLSGNLEKIAKFQLAFRKEAVEASRLSGADIAAINAGRRPGGVSVLGGAQRAMEATVGKGAKAFLLSDFVQGNLTNPREVQNFSSILARYISENAINQQAEPPPEAPAR